MATSPTQLDRIETAIAALRILILGLIEGQAQMTTSVADLVTQLDSATTLLAGKIDAANTAIAGGVTLLTTEQQALTDMEDRLRQIITTLQQQGVPQPTIDLLTSVVGRLGTAAGNVDSVNTQLISASATITAHTATLASIGTDPNNPIPLALKPAGA